MESRNQRQCEPSSGPRAAALDEAAQHRVGRGCCMGCPKTIAPACKPGCLHTQCSCTHSCTRQAPRAGWTGTRSQQCHPGQGPQQHGDACSPQVPRLERDQEEKAPPFPAALHMLRAKAPRVPKQLNPLLQLQWVKNKIATGIPKKTPPGRASRQVTCTGTGDTAGSLQSKARPNATIRAPPRGWLPVPL